MATQYSEVFKKFTIIIRGSSHLGLTLGDLEVLFEDYLSFGCFYFNQCEQDLTDRSDLLKRFNIDLTDTEQWIIAHGMVIGWLKPLINYEENMIVSIGDRDYNPGSSGNHIDKLTKLYNNSIEELDGFIIGYGYSGDDLSELA